MPVVPGKQLRLSVTEPVRALRGDTVMENLWVAIRAMKSFTTAEIAFQASTDTLKVSEHVAGRCLNILRDAGYLKCVLEPASGTRSWRLVPRMDTGPKPPMLIQVSLVFDRNKRAVVDGPHSEELIP